MNDMPIDKNDALALGGLEWPRDSWRNSAIPSASQDSASWMPEEAKRPVCAAPGCNALGRFWKRTGRPILDGRWACGRACLSKLVEAAVWRELGDSAAEGVEVTHRHRVPLGLVLLAQGSITQQQLQQALAAQEREGRGRIGEWLVQLCKVDQRDITRALGVQWNCPVLPTSGFDPRRMALVMPKQLRERFGVLPLRVAGGKILYLGTEERVDAATVFALERMSGLTVESGLLPTEEMLEGSARVAACDSVECLETQVKTSGALVETVSSALMQAQPIASRMVRLHEFFWVRMWLERASVGRFGTLPATGEDVVDLLYRVGSLAA
jgi:hypothetical protein